MKKIIRKITKNLLSEEILFKFSNGKSDDNFFVKILPRHFQYNSEDIRFVKRNDINYKLSLDNYNDFILFYGINNQNKDIMYSLIKDGDVVLDVGTNIGEVILNIAKKNIKGKIYGFEPVDYNYEKLLTNISLNNFSNIIVNKLALSDKKETLFYQEKKGHSGGISMNKEVRNGNNYKAIESLTLDEFVKEKRLEKIDFIKVDIEGFEMNFLQGAKETIKKFKPRLFFEIDEKKLIQQRTSPEKLMEEIRFLGYKIIDVESKIEIMPNERAKVHSDIYCLPIE